MGQGRDNVPMEDDLTQPNSGNLGTQQTQVRGRPYREEIVRASREAFVTCVRFLGAALSPSSK